MLLSLALMFILGIILGELFKKLRLPSLLGMIITGIILGPFALNLIDSSIMDISSQLRQIALIIVLTRAGLSLNIPDLKRIGRPALLMCFVPACFEIAAMVVFAPIYLGVSYLDAAIMGAVLGAVSPAVIVPRMIYLSEHSYGKSKSIPQMIMAGASVDDVFVIVLFSAFTSMATGQSVSVISFVLVPVSIFLGAVMGIIVGILLSLLFKYVHMRDSIKVIIILSISFLFVWGESVDKIIPFSGLIAVMCVGIALNQKREETAKRISLKYNKLWVAAEILLFVLVGATVNPEYALKSGALAIALIFTVLVFRMIGVFVCLIKTKLNLKEKFFCMVAYIPKATVQAAIGGVPLAMGLACGETVLTVAVLSILLTAPLGAMGIDLLYKKCLKKEE